jgi:hypothetical protein
MVQLAKVYQKTSRQNTSRILISKEVKRASGIRIIETDFKADSIIGIWSYSDYARVYNYAPTGGYVIDGKKVYLISREFNFCDQMVVISYYASGMVFNTVVYNKTFGDTFGEATFGEAFVVATLHGKESSHQIFIENYCKCKSTLNVSVEPTSIEVGETSEIVVYVENGGMPVSGTIHMMETTGKGSLQWNSMPTGVYTVTGEKTEAINSISGVTQCVTNSVITEVFGVYTIDEENVQGTINYYSAFNGRTIDLTTYLPTGTNLVVNYSRAGSITNYLTGVSAGTAQVITSMDVNTEEGLSQSSSITITAPPEKAITPDPGGPGGPGGTYFVRGPGAVQFKGSYAYYDPQAGGGFNRYNLPLYEQTFGPWLLVNADTDENVLNQQISCSGQGYIQPINGNCIKTNPQTPNQTMTITLTGNNGERAEMQVTYTKV